MARTFHVELLEYSSMQPNGDRDRNVHPCSRWDVLALVMEDGKIVNNMILNTFNQFDAYRTHIRAREPVVKAAREYALAAAGLFGVDLVERTFRPRPPRPATTEWEEITS